MKRIWAAPFAFLYGIGVWVRHKMFDWGWLRSVEYDIPIVNVGNLTVGGTGKTPFTELLIGKLGDQYTIAVLSRGYKRRTKGYLEVLSTTKTLDAGDEPKQIKTKFPEITVAVCEKRTEGIERIRLEHPQVDLIILDDGFQHRYVKPWVDIVLMDYNRPIYKDHLLPWGSLRDTKSQLRRAGYLVITKCPAGMTPIDRRIVKKSLGLYPYQSLYFSSTDPKAIKPVFPEDARGILKAGSEVIAMSGIGNPDAFRQTLSLNHKVTDELVYPDHHVYRKKDLKTMMKLLEDYGGEIPIVTTEKDMVKLAGSKKIPVEIRRRLFYLPIGIKFYDDTENDFFNKLSYDIRTNPDDRLFRS